MYNRKLPLLLQLRLQRLLQQNGQSQGLVPDLVPEGRDLVLDQDRDLDQGKNTENKVEAVPDRIHGGERKDHDLESEGLPHIPVVPVLLHGKDLEDLEDIPIHLEVAVEVEVVVDPLLGDEALIMTWKGRDQLLGVYLAWTLCLDRGTGRLPLSIRYWEVILSICPNSNSR